MTKDNKIYSSINSKYKMVKNSLFIFKNLNKTTNYLIFKAILVLMQLKKTFTKALIFQHFDLKIYIWIETNISDYIIN